MALIQILLAIFVFSIPLLAMLVLRRIGLVRLQGLLTGELRFREFQAEPVEVASFSSSVAAHFERHTPKLLLLGFERIGDYRLLHMPEPAVMRFFISRDHRTFAAIEVCGAKQTYSFFGVFEDGVYLESCAMKGPRLSRVPNVPLEHNQVPGASVDQLWQAHVLAIEEHRQAHNGGMLEFAPEQFQEVADYGHRLVWWRLHNQGITAQPPAPMRPEMVEV